MNNKFNKILATILIAAMILSVVPAFANSYNADSFWIEPDDIDFATDTTSVGHKFTVTVWTNTSVETYTWQVKMDFDTAHLNATQAGYTGVGKSLFFTGHTTVPVSPVIDNTAGYVQHGESLSGDDSKEPDLDSLFWVEFEIIAAPPKGGELNSLLDINNVDTYWLTPGLDEVSPMNKYNADYTYTWSPPPNPHLAALNSTGGTEVIFGQYTNITDLYPSGALFDIDIYAMDVDAAWWLHNVSFSLAYNATFLEVTTTVFDPLWATTSQGGVAGDLDFFVADPTSTPSGDVLLVTLTFNVTLQYIAGPMTPWNPGDKMTTPLDIHTYEMWDTSIEIPTDPEVDGLVEVYAFVVLQLAYLEVSNVTMGPEPCRGEVFNVTVSIKNLDWHWYLIAIEFRLAYDPDLITPLLTHIEGPFLPSFAALQPGSMGTFWQTFNEPANARPEHVLVGNMIFPNGSGWWNPPYPGDEGVVAILQFEVAYQSYGEADLTCPLEIIDQGLVGLDGEDTQNIVGIPMDPPVNGEYWITTDLPGRVLDLYGGAMNKGYGSWPFPAPYGGQGPDNPMDLVVDQSHVCFFAEVTYNYWPVQTKIVSYEVEKPDRTILLKTTAITNDVGIASITFQMPWPCDRPEDLFGVWTVTATVSISDVQVNDTLTFHYDYLIGWMKVTTDKFEYDHCEDVEITIEYGTHAQQSYPLLLAVVLMDELDVPVGMALLDFTVGGAEYCTYTNFTTTTTIHVIKWAFAGIAYVHVNAFDKNPTVGGVAWCPEAVPAEICIQPF